MSRLGLGAWCVGAGIAAVAVGTAVENPQVSVRLVTLRTDYFTGEPVLLDAIVTNTTPMDLAIGGAGYDGGEGDIAIYIASEGPPERFEFGGEDCVESRLSGPPLRPGESIHHAASILYSRAGGGKLAFPRPGAYAIKVVYPLLLRDVPGRREIESNSVPIRILPPTGEDEQVWRRIRSHEVLDFLQFDDGPNQERAVMTLVEALKARPDSRYRQSYADALRRFSRQGGERHLSPEEREKFREVLGIPAREERGDGAGPPGAK